MMHRDSFQLITSNYCEVVLILFLGVYEEVFAMHTS